MSSAVSCTISCPRVSLTSGGSCAPVACRIQSIGRTKSGQYSCCVITSMSSDGSIILPGVLISTPAGSDIACRPQPASIAKAVLLPAPFGPVTAYTRPAGSTSCGTFTWREAPRENSMSSKRSAAADGSTSQRMRPRALASERRLASSCRRSMFVCMVASSAWLRERVSSMSIASSTTREYTQMSTLPMCLISRRKPSVHSMPGCIMSCQ
mmetsp:Transcript_105212/g.314256  ORF Transcript_105212/g.314256 Transcript_105212/m.314256 type:complete len:210 (+) Transcript_105212:489-1118(+)